jgi:hypothetical protein
MPPLGHRRIAKLLEPKKGKALPMPQWLSSTGDCRLIDRFMHVAEEMSSKSSRGIDFRIRRPGALLEPIRPLMGEKQADFVVAVPIAYVIANGIQLSDVTGQTAAIVSSGELQERRIQTYDTVLQIWRYSLSWSRWARKDAARPVRNGDP